MSMNIYMYATLPWVDGVARIQITFFVGNATYLSHQVQNEMIDTIGQAITDNIVRRVHKAEYFSVMVDETPDCSHQEQLCIVLRYVLGCDVEERLLRITEANTTTSEALFGILSTALQELDIDVNNLRRQCYDGASNVSGVHSGLQAQMKALAPSSLFVHCYAHILNLVIVDAMSANRMARDFFGIMQNFYVFIGNCSKRHAVYKEKQLELASDGNRTVQVRSLKNLSGTCWVCRADGTNSINATLEAVIVSLEHIHESDAKPNIVAEAKGLLKSIDFKFILSLVVSIGKIIN